MNLDDGTPSLTCGTLELLRRPRGPLRPTPCTSGHAASPSCRNCCAELPLWYSCRETPSYCGSALLCDHMLPARPSLMTGLRSNLCRCGGAFVVLHGTWHDAVVQRGTAERGMSCLSFLLERFVTKFVSTGVCPFPDTLLHPRRPPSLSSAAT